MQNITFTCEIITPMFLSGADGNTPELRPSSIKGALRFWWRAMNGGDWKELKKKEDEIFGSTDKKSKLLISISENWKFSKSDEFITKNNYKNKYLFFPLQMLDEKQGVPEGKIFKIELSSKDKEVLKRGIATFWLFSFLGGLGFRSRRGGGNIFAEPTKGNIELVEECNISFKASNKNETLQNFIERNLESCKRIIVGENRQSESSDYSNLINSKVIISNHSSTLSQIENLYKRFRSLKKGDSNLMLKAAFGLPLNSKMPNQPKRDTSDHTEIKIVDSKDDRRSSPIILRMVKFHDRLYWLVLKLNGIFLDREISLIRTQSKQEVLAPQQVDDSLLDEFLEELIENQNIEIQL
jgi:CRISPR-associated protein Cmr1